MHKKRILRLLAALLICFPGYSSTQALITEKNWVNHPKIVEIRIIYNEIEDAIKEKRLTKKTKTHEYEGPYVKPTLKAVFFDEANAVMKYIEENGSDDSALRFSYYYDTKKACGLFLSKAER